MSQNQNRRRQKEIQTIVEDNQCIIELIGMYNFLHLYFFYPEQLQYIREIREEIEDSNQRVRQSMEKLDNINADMIV